MSMPAQATATPPQGTSIQPREGRRRRPSSSEEDPLTSAAFALRPSGPVDGRSALRARNRSQDRPAGSDPVSGESYGSTPPYPYATPSYGGQSSVTETMNTPPYGESYGYANGHGAHGAHGAHAAPADRPRRSGTGSYQGTHQAPGSQQGTGSQQTTNGHQGTGSHQATGSQQGTGSYRTGSYPAGSYQGTGSHPAGAAYPGNGYSGNGHQRGGYPGNGHLGNGNGNGHRAPYDPRDDYRRLTHQR
jgi:hypothetical protein